MNKPVDTEVLKSDPVLGEIVARLTDAYRPERVYLFGSTARGEAGPNSDDDLLLVVPDDTSPDRRRSRLAYQVLWGLKRGADVLVWRRTSFERRLQVNASLPAAILREGKLIYAA